MTKKIILSIFVLVVSLAQTISQTREFLRPPAKIYSEHNIQDSTVELTWWVPGTPAWFFYSGSFETAFSFGQTAEYEMAIKYAPGDLKIYQDYQVKKYAFVPYEEVGEYIFKIWMGENADSVVYVDTLETFTKGAWNYVDVNSGVVLDSTQTYYFGFRVKTFGEGSVGVDLQKAVRGKSDLINVSGQFQSLSDLIKKDVNWNIAIYGALPEEVIVSIVALNDAPINSANSANVQIIPIKDKAVKFEATIEAQRGITPDEYNVYRDGVKIGLVDKNYFADTLPDGGYFYYQVSAIYQGKESSLSDKYEVAYDNMRVAKSKIISEVFLNVHVPGAGGYQGSPGSPLAFQGITQLKAFDTDNKIAPIVYHSATSILGPDKFSNEDSEGRFAYYILNTGLFPFAAFNGDLYSGVSTEVSPYSMFDEKATQAKELLTPITISGKLFKVKNTEFRLDVTADMVGIYEKEGCVLQVAITKDTIVHQWDNFDAVNFVCQRMVPNFNGTPVVFDQNGKAQLSISIPFDPFANLSELKAVFFLQDKKNFTILDGNEIVLSDYTVVTDYNTLAISSRVFPNPASNSLYVISEEQTHLTIYSSTGVPVYTSTLLCEKNTIDVAHLAQGIYLAVFENNGRSAVKRFVKQ